MVKLFASTFIEFVLIIQSDQCQFRVLGQHGREFFRVGDGIEVVGVVGRARVFKKLPGSVDISIIRRIRVGVLEGSRILFFFVL